MTLVAPPKPEPVIVTFAPIDPLVGVKLVMTGTTLKTWLLVRTPDGVVTVTLPVVAVVGTFAVRNVSETTVKVAGAPLKETLVVPLNPCPRNWMVAPALPHLNEGKMLTNGPNPMLRL